MAYELKNMFVMAIKNSNEAADDAMPLTYKYCRLSAKMALIVKHPKMNAVAKSAVGRIEVSMNKVISRSGPKDKPIGANRLN